MPCNLLGCHIIRKDGSRTELDHDKHTKPGTAFYYCSIHRVHHCVEPRAHRRLPQPPCGECAWLFFRCPTEAARYPESDVPLVVTGGGPTALVPDSDADDDVAMTSGWDDGYDPASGGYAGRSTSAVGNGYGYGYGYGYDYDHTADPLSVLDGVIRDLDDWDSDGDVIMRDAAAAATPPPTTTSSPLPPSSLLPSFAPSPPPPTSPPHRLPPAGSIVRVPVAVRRDVRTRTLGEAIPSWTASAVRPLGWHRRAQGVYLFAYTDVLGRPAVQPAAREPAIREYFGEEDERSQKGQGGGRGGGGCDPVLLEARRWCCWAQGFSLPEPEMRWALTLVFDLVNVLIARQRAAAKETGRWCGGGGGHCYGTASGGGVHYGVGAIGADGNPGEPFWLGRYYLFKLLNVVADMRDEFGIDNMTIPVFPWLSPN
ncbi:hypothetical protein GGR53DRAFT_464509 [Hypoxylon sp. FL1150]|nr:hypothetical protein GGR53DRAFT_464509 [Hypoxylon sp. FL1150]